MPVGETNTMLEFVALALKPVQGVSQKTVVASTAVSEPQAPDEV